MDAETREFYKKIKSFCARHCLSESAFGRSALSDPNFLSDLRAGRSPTRRTVCKVQKHMEKEDGKAECRRRQVD